MRWIRFDYWLRAIIAFIFGIVFIIVLPLFFPTFLNKVSISRGISIGLGFMFWVVGFINYLFVKSDKDTGTAKDKRIRDLEKELRKHKGTNIEKLEGYRMRDFD